MTDRQQLSTVMGQFKQTISQHTFGTFAFAPFYFSFWKSKTKRAKFCPRSVLVQCILTGLFFIDTCFAQTNQPQTPQVQTFQPVNTGQYYTNSSVNQIPNQQTPTHNSQMGGNADDIINQQNQRASQMMGAPIYKAGSTPEENQKANMLYIQQRMQNDPAYQMPNSANNFSQVRLQKHKEILDLLNEVHAEEKGRPNFDMKYFKTPEFTTKTKSYTGALQNLKEQLSGKRKLSVADAYFIMENAYGNSYLTKKEYDNILNEGADFMQKWLVQNGYNPNDNEAKHLAMQKFLKDTLTITITSPDNISQPKKITHYPFFYDYEDFKGEKDYRNYFITKCLATGSGQCNSLPAAYNSYAEKLGAKSYLTFAPLHSFVKYPDNNGKIKSYEPTSSWHISDQWYSDNMFISPKAKASGIYLDTLNRKQIVANCMIDLAFGYLKKYGVADGEFVKDCISSAMQHFPKQNNIHAYFVYSSLLARQLETILYRNNIKDLKDINKFPEASELYNALTKNEETIKQLGYQDTPEQLYEELMQEHEFKGKKQQEKNLSGKEKRNLFVKTN